MPGSLKTPKEGKVHANVCVDCGHVMLGLSLLDARKLEDIRKWEAIPIMNIRRDLLKRKSKIAKITAYSSLRNGSLFSLNYKKSCVLITMDPLYNFLLFSIEMPGLVFQIMITLGSTAISLIFLSVIEDFLNALIDGIDLRCS